MIFENCKQMNHGKLNPGNQLERRKIDTISRFFLKATKPSTHTSTLLQITTRNGSHSRLSECHYDSKC